MKVFRYFNLILLCVLSTVGLLSECQGSNINDVNDISINRFYYNNYGNGLINQIIERHYAQIYLSKGYYCHKPRRGHSIVVPRKACKADRNDNDNDNDDDSESMGCDNQTVDCQFAMSMISNQRLNQDNGWSMV